MEEKRIDFEKRVRQKAKEFSYPPTPNLTGTLQDGVSPARRSRRRLAWALLVAVVLLVSAVAAPGVRARLLEFVQIGAVRIFVSEPTAIVVHESAAQDGPNTATPAADTLLTQAAGPVVRELHSVLDLSGETTLENARAQVDFAIPLPGYPPDLGPPDKVFLQEISGPVVVLVWLQAGTQDEVRLSLHILGPGAFANKGGPPPVVEWTEVNGREAVWKEVGYVLSYGGPEVELHRFIDSPVLVWEEGELTFRLEIAGSMEEAIRIAESLVYEE